ILQPAGQSRSILHLSTIDGFQTNHRHLRTFILGDDISIRVKAVMAALKKAGVLHPGIVGHKLVLEKIFYQFCNLSLAPVTLVFVFDGPGRPPIKRDTRVIHRGSWLMGRLKKMITYFGFHYFDARCIFPAAPGEAEAELAHLNSYSFIDGILTQDSDAFLFGARLVIRTTGPSVQDSSAVYSMDAIKNSVDLTRGGLLLCVLLLGGDYDKGFRGVGPTIAYPLARLFGPLLLHYWMDFTGEERSRKLASWRAVVGWELQRNPRGEFPRCYPHLVIPESFPNPHVINLYTDPLVSGSLRYTGPAPDVAAWKPQQPDIQSISTFCTDTFGWRGEHLEEKFRSKLWPAMTFRLISSVSLHSIRLLERCMIEIPTAKCGVSS
ncbi:PIN domain-like protein, partial [Roridomyces roridus]